MSSGESSGTAAPSDLPHHQNTNQQEREQRQQSHSTTQRRNIISAGFDPETRAKIANIAKKNAPPTLLMEEDGKNGEHQHPILYLHKSVNNTQKQRGSEGQRREINTEGTRQEQFFRSKERSNIAKPTVASNPVVEEGSSRDTDDANLQFNCESSKKMMVSSPERPKPRHQPKEGNGSFGRTLVKTIVVTLLPILWLTLMQTAFVNSHVENPPRILTEASAAVASMQSSVADFLRDWSVRLVPAFAASDGRRASMTEQLEGRIAVGRELLRTYDDPSGSAAACEGAFRSIVDAVVGGGSASRQQRGISNGKDNGSTLMSVVSSSIVASSVVENKLMSKTLLCLGEAQLALYSSMLGSRDMKRVQLLAAKESFEAAMAVDPTDPSIRSGLGLSYLLLGVTEQHHEYDGDAESSIQFLYQSIQHLKAAVGLIKSDAGRNAHGDEDLKPIRTATMHNLGLAYMSLDQLSLTSSDPSGMESTHFADWVTSLRSSEGASYAVADSWVFAANEGASLLQQGKVDNAISSLEIVADGVCTASQSTSRAEELCYLVQQNLAAAKGALIGKEEGYVREQLEDSQSIHGENVKEDRVDSEAIPAEVSTPELDLDTNTTSSLSGESPESAVDTPTDEELTASKDDTPAAETKHNHHDMMGEKDPSLPSTPWGLKKVKPEMQNALDALEKATVEGTQRTRLLLALARARASAGDSSGAIDAALKAISAAATEEEYESSTAYLEMLMEKMAGTESAKEATDTQQEPLSMQEKNSGYVENKDFALSELSLKLELEKLKYKVLEQEMMLGRRRDPANYETGLPAIDYQEDIDSRSRDMPRHQRAHREEKIVVSKTETMSLEGETTADAVNEQESATIGGDGDVVEDATVVVIDDTDQGDKDTDSSEHDSTGNEMIVESQDSPAEPLVEAAEADASEVGENQTATEINSVKSTNSSDEEGQANVQLIQLPGLFQPALHAPTAISATAKSYMKMADAYLDKSKYALAAKQFLKVIKKAPEHLPAHLGYATAIERTGKSKQMNTAALAYGNATKAAIIQGERVDPLVKAGSGGLGENILRRGVQIAKTAPSERLETLQQLSACAHTFALAADVYYEIGLEMSKAGLEQEDNKANAVEAFSIANEFVVRRNDTETPYHIGSIIELSRIALEHDNNGARVIENFIKIKDVHMDDDKHVELLVLVGRAHVSLEDLEQSIIEFTRAISFPECTSTPLAHHELAIALQKNGGDTHEINPHFEKALDMGMDPTQESIDALGERNLSLMKALNRQYYKNYNSGHAESAGGGGIMSGGGVGSQSSSVFAPQPQHEETSAQSETLTLLEQGAAAYDGHTPGGGEVEGTESSLSQLKGKKQQGSESKLSDLRR